MIREHNKNDDWNIIQKIIQSDYWYWSGQGSDCLLHTNPLLPLLPLLPLFPLLPCPLSPLFIVVTKAEVFVYNLALSLVLSEQVKQTHCPTLYPVLSGHIFTAITLLLPQQWENKTWRLISSRCPDSFHTVFWYVPFVFSDILPGNVARGLVWSSGRLPQ